MYLSSVSRESLLILQTLVQRTHKVHPISFLEAERFILKAQTLRPLEEYRDDSAAVAAQFVEERNEDPDLGTEGDGDENEGGSTDAEDDNEKV